MSRILLIGARSFLGETLARGLQQADHDVIAVSRAELDLERAVAPQFETLLAASGRTHITHAILCAAVTDVEACFKDPQKSQRVNIDAGMEWLDICAKHAIQPIFFSSDLVFSGTKQFYAETDEPAPPTLYGRQKLAMEQAIGAATPKHLIFRTSKLMSMDLRPRNILAPIVGAIRARETYRAFTDQWITPVFVEDIARIVASAIDRELRGTFHLAGPESLTRFELASQVARVMGAPSALVQPTSLTAAGFSEPRGARNCIDGSKIAQTLAFRYTPFEEGLKVLCSGF